ncbi:COX15/CtaA family protein [Legionella waltersii]|uniref:Cytochrome c oxidase assembly protein n=1 Tax=Legionella waltersii TaxID=66969 RepID=A0A0W1A2D2_9GAMM|nr:COX15/CtaA family protein [Legionella waltersii]KTD75521.1 cytochrome c oxidase assembly protein [Legionella waltersii]SNU98469.1 cytochrome c oxidase assembly protein [Legionella waltersii]
MSRSPIKHIVLVSTVLALIVVMLGAYTRLTNAGLGCPDWPGCYGHMVLPGADLGLQNAQVKFPDMPIEKSKAWTEMVHRYLAGTLGLFIVIIGIFTLHNRVKAGDMPWHIPALLFLLVIFQAALGMWTVTLKLLPVVVMSHLLGGVLIFSFLSRYNFQLSKIKGADLPYWRPWLRLGFFIVLSQIALGGWVSANYAGISCIGFPTCNGVWVPELHFAKGFNLFSEVGANYQGGLLESEVRVSIQFMHRLGALITASYLLILSVLLMKFSSYRPLKIMGIVIAALVLLQFTLGVLNVMYLLPLAVAVAHNGVAALLLAAVFSSLHFTRGMLKHVH